jgi:hypothetical protein
VRPLFRSGEVIGRWELLKRLGMGGNGEVWQATAEADPVALKLVAKRVQSEPYKRFVREVDTVQSVGSMRGVLPVYETHLPSAPSRKDPAWIAMPIATPVREALADASLDEIVSAVQVFATTLSLLAERGISHRDIKPGNLYWYEDDWFVGDFGLVSLPDASDLTGNRLGPFGYMPDEMFDTANESDGSPVDVFQLAKTLTVLVTRQAYPPQGSIPAGSSGALSRFAVHPRIGSLEELIERCTRRDPDRRPTMATVAQELGAWLETPERQAPDLSEVAARFRAANAEALAGTAQADELRQRFEALTGEAFGRLLQPVADALDDAGLSPALAYFHDLHTWVERRRFLGSTMQLASDQRWVVASYGRIEWPQKIAIGLGFDLDTEGELACMAHVAAGDLESTATKQWRFDEVTVPIESSVSVDRGLDDLGREILEAVGEMLAALAA